MSNPAKILRLSDLQPGEAGDCFVYLAAKERAATRDGKPYFRVQFRDATRTVTAMVWSDSAWFAECEGKWKTGTFYKVRGRYFENQYGPQLDVDRIREVEDADRETGFNPAGFFRASRFDVDRMFADLCAIASAEIGDNPLKQLVLAILEEHAESIRRIPAASQNHHAFTGGFLEHVLSVTRTAVFLADKYAGAYPDMNPPLSKSLVVAGAILHDIGKIAELDYHPEGTTYTPAGRLIGHILQGRDIVRDAANQVPGIDPETLLRLEHVIVSHQNLPEWGSPIAPHTPEALLVHFADDIDAKFQMMADALEASAASDEPFTDRHNPLRRRIYRGPGGSSQG
jgi:3'-5' exoribonuclease